MAELQFNPPPAWLMQEYYNRKQPAEIANEGIGNAIQSYATIKSAQQTKQNEALGTYVKAFEAGGPVFAADVAKKIGLQNPPALPGVRAPMVSPGGVAGQMVQPGQPAPVQSGGPQPTPVEDAAQASMPDQHPATPMTPAQGTAAQSPIIAHWNQTMGQGATGQTPMTPTSPQGPTLPGQPDTEALLGMGNFGRRELTARESLQKLNDAQDARLARTQDQPVVTQDEALSSGKVKPGTHIINPKDTSAADNRRQDQLARAVTDYGKQIETNPVIHNLQMQNIGLHNVEEMAQLTAQGNTVASAAMGMKMARAMGEVGVITENDVKRYVQSRKLTQAAGDKLSGWLNGVPSKATLDEIHQITSTLKDSYDSKIQPIYNRYIDRFARAYKMTPEDAAYQLAFPYNKGTGAGDSQGGGMPQIGGTFEGGKVLKVTKVEKAPK